MPSPFSAVLSNLNPRASLSDIFKVAVNVGVELGLLRAPPAVKNSTGVAMAKTNVRPSPTQIPKTGQPGGNRGRPQTSQMARVPKVLPDDDSDWVATC